MPFDYQGLRTKLVDHLIWLETIDLDYAIWALNNYRRWEGGLYVDILKDIKTEKARRAAEKPT